MPDVASEAVGNRMGKDRKATEGFDRKMEEPQKAALDKNWIAFKNFFRHNRQALLEPFDLALNTAIHVTTRSNNPILLEELIDMLPCPYDRWRALRKENAHKNTVLHHIIHCSEVEMVDAVLNYDNYLKPPEEKESPLLELKNNLGETPVYRAAKYGKLKILERMARNLNMEKHFDRNDGTSILHIAIIGQCFDVAMWLSKVNAIDKLVREADGKRLTCLQLLSRMPSVFRSNISHMEFFEKLIYFLLPEQEFEASDNGKVKETDIESGTKDNANYTTSEYDGINNIWKTKKNHKLAERLADFLVQGDYSWKDSCQAEQREEVVLPVIQPSNIAARKKSKLLKSPSIDEPIHCKDCTPLLLAASTGIVEIVKRIIDKYPQAIAHVSPLDGQNVLHVAVKHRQKKIYKILKEDGAFSRLASQMDNKSRTLLHQVARMDHYNGENKAGVVFQLQDELQWFERVRKAVPPSYILYCNDDDLTARELFEIEHADMLKEAQDWIKGTAQSCSAVAVLVATVVFAAAYTIPGGTNDNGIPIFLNSPLFLFFTITDIVALSSSLVSVIVFLSILTSPFEMKDFHKSLPRKSTFGFTLLFISLTTTMLAFGSTILLTIQLEQDKWTSSLIYSVTFLPVTLFALMQFPIYMSLSYRVKRHWKAFKKVLPSRFSK